MASGSISVLMLDAEDGGCDARPGGLGGGAPLSTTRICKLIQKKQKKQKQKKHEDIPISNMNILYLRNVINYIFFFFRHVSTEALRASYLMPWGILGASPLGPPFFYAT